MCDHFPLALASSVMLYTEQSFHERWLRARLQQQSTRGATDETLSQDQGHRIQVKCKSLKAGKWASRASDFAGDPVSDLEGSTQGRVSLISSQEL